MSRDASSRPRRLPVGSEPLVAGEEYDYADAFAITAGPDDSRSAEQWMRDALQGSPPALRWLIVVVHANVLRFRLGPRNDADHVLGWRVTSSEPDVVRLDATGPLICATLVGRRRDPQTVELRSFVRFVRQPLAQRVWSVVGIVHRRVAPYLLKRSREAGHATIRHQPHQ